MARTLPGGPGTPAAIDFGPLLRRHVPELGVLELDDARLVLPSGWLLGRDDRLLAHHSWFGQGSAGGLPDDGLLVGKVEEALRGAETTPLPGTTLSLLTDFGDNYFHFLFDALGRLALVAAAGIDPREVDRILVPRPATENARRMLAATGLPVGAIVPIGPLDGRILVAERLLAPTFPGAPRCVGAIVCRFLRSRLLPHGPADRSATRLYVDRPASGRPMENRDEVLPVMAEHGFRIYDPSNHDDQPADFAAATIVVGAHGAGLANLVFSRPGTRVLELLPTDHAYPYYFTLALAAGLDHAVLPCRSCRHRPPGAFGPSPLPFHVDIDSLRRALSAMDADDIRGLAERGWVPGLAGARGGPLRPSPGPRPGERP